MEEQSPCDWACCRSPTEFKRISCFDAPLRSRLTGEINGTSQRSKVMCSSLGNEFDCSVDLLIQFMSRPWTEPAFDALVANFAWNAEFLWHVVSIVRPGALSGRAAL